MGVTVIFRDGPQIGYLCASFCRQHSSPHCEDGAVQHGGPPGLQRGCAHRRWGTTHPKQHHQTGNQGLFVFVEIHLNSECLIILQCIIYGKQRMNPSIYLTNMLTETLFACCSHAGVTPGGFPRSAKLELERWELAFKR